MDEFTHGRGPGHAFICCGASEAALALVLGVLGSQTRLLTARFMIRHTMSRRLIDG